MEERKLKRKSPRTSTSTAAPTGGSGRKSSSSTGGRRVGSGFNAGTNQKSKRRGVRDKASVRRVRGLNRIRTRAQGHRSSSTPF
ncbi:unnamed protein product [Pleuronectes platessa]|uniref:Uncharacterized protein n=1 Tax=Pleuronectes platessa TaxID=8262 RepID=A0A9N7TSE5_PLEPL|nr:unnamed protein product [Pleuronectes platessa]